MNMTQRIAGTTVVLAMLLGACGSTGTDGTNSEAVASTSSSVPDQSSPDQAAPGNAATSTSTDPGSVDTSPATVAPTTTTVPRPRTTALATPEDPVPPGEVIEFTGVWDIAVTDIDFDATEYVLGLNQINPEPDPGYQYLLIGLVGTYLGDRVAEPVFEWAVSDGSTTFTPSIPGCGVIPDSIYDVVEVIPGESFQGSICVPVLSTSVAAGGLELFLQLPADDPKYFLLE